MTSWRGRRRRGTSPPPWRAAALGIVTALLAAALALAPAPPTGGQEIDDEESPGDLGGEAIEQSFPLADPCAAEERDEDPDVFGRRTFGLDASPETIVALRAGAGVDIGVGFLVFAHEVAGVQHQLQIQAERQEAGPALEEQLGPEYAGGWIDHSRGGLVVIAMVGEHDPVAIAQLVQAHVPSAGAVELLAFDYSMAELQVLQEEVAAAWDTFTELGIVVTSVGVSVPANRVLVGVDALSAESHEQVLALFDHDPRLAVCPAEMGFAGIALDDPEPAPEPVVAAPRFTG